MLPKRSVAATALIVLVAAVPAALAHGGGSLNYISSVRSVAPADAGVSVRVLERDDRLELRYRGAGAVIVEGYNGEPYARVSGDGTVEVNRRSPALYLNQERFGGSDVPPTADEDAAPAWEVKDRSGRFDWHDHRMHWMGRERPEKVSDPDRRTTVFDWRVPLRVKGEKGAIEGRLVWVPTPSVGLPGVLWVGLAAAVLGCVGLFFAVRRHRRVMADGPQAEAW